MYIIVNSDLKMSKGKIAAQAAHVATKASHFAANQSDHRLDDWNKWWLGSHTKIVLKAPEKALNDLLELGEHDWCFGVIDEGRTEVASGSLTAIATIPILKGSAGPAINDLKLL